MPELNALQMFMDLRIETRRKIADDLKLTRPSDHLQKNDFYRSRHWVLIAFESGMVAELYKRAEEAFNDQEGI